MQAFSAPISSSPGTGGFGRRLVRAISANQAVVATKQGILQVEWQQGEPVEKGVGPLQLQENIQPLLSSSSSSAELINYNNIQSLSWEKDGEGGFLVAVDGLGNGVAARTDVNGKAVGDLSSLVNIKGSGAGEAGWHGVSCRPLSEEGGLIAVASYWNRSLSLFSPSSSPSSSPLVSYPLFAPPLCVALAPPSSLGSSSPLAVVGEGREVCVYDYRLPAKTACIAREQGGEEKLYCVDVADTMVACGGEDHSVRIFDCRKWGAIGHLRCMKQPVSEVRFSGTDSRYCFIVGVDSEVVVGEWGAHHSGSERDDRPGLVTSRVGKKWMGIDIVKGTNTLVGLNIPSSLFVLHGSLQAAPSSESYGPTPMCDED